MFWRVKFVHVFSLSGKGHTLNTGIRWCNLMGSLHWGWWDRMTGHVLRTVVEVYMNIYTFSSTWLTMSGTYHYHKGKGSCKNLQTSFPEWSVVPPENFALMGKPLFHDRQNLDSMVDKTLYPYWMREACLNWLCYQAWVEITLIHAQGTFPFHPLWSWWFLLWGHLLQPIGWVSSLLGWCQVYV